MRYVRFLVLLATAAARAAVKLHAAESATATSEVPSADLKELNDPTILSRRIWFETEWNKFADGTHIVEETAGGLWAWRVSTNRSPRNGNTSARIPFARVW